jgi:GntR family transcriptional regulator
MRSGVPIYQQIVEQIENMLVSGELKDGDQLPTVRQLAKHLEVNFNTVARAYRVLDEAGMLTTQQGRGTYILDNRTNQENEEKKKEMLLIKAKHYLEEASNLGVSLEEAIEVIMNQMALNQVLEEKEETK